MKLLANPFQAFRLRSGDVAADSSGLIVVTALGDVRELLNAGAHVLPGNFQGANNYAATTDPGVGNDNTQDYVAGSRWLNVSNGRMWTCVSNATGAASWSFNGAVVGNAQPAAQVTQFGSIALGATFGAFLTQGNLYRNVGHPIAGNAADTTDDILVGFVLPANAFDVANRGLHLVVAGMFGANGNDKRIKVWANPTMAGQTVTAGVISGGTVSGVGSGVLLFDSGVQTTNNGGFFAEGRLVKYGAAASNTQYSQFRAAYGSTSAGVTAAVFSTLPENAVINLVVTGASPTTGAANDAVLDYFAANALN
jgi:hypothetical protein